MSQKKIVILGNGATGTFAAQSARQENPDVQIVIYSHDEWLPYYRLRLAEILLDPANAEKLYLHPASWYDEQDIELHLGKTATHVDPDAKELHFEDGSRVSYDRLILATGSRPFVPPFEGKDLPGVETLWTMDDALKIEREITEGEQAVVIGGGLLGLEMAHNLAQRGMDVSIIEHNDRLLARQLDEAASEIFERQVKQKGIHVVKNGDTTELVPGDDGRVAKVLLKDGREIPARLVIISTGVRANVQTVSPDEVKINRRVVVNEKMETSTPDIYAAGDVATVDDHWFGLWTISMNQGKVAGINAAGGEARYTSTVPPYRVNTMGTHINSAGVIKEPQEHAGEYREEIEKDEAKLTYKKVCYLDDKVCGYILVGDISEANRLQKQMNQ